MLKREPTGWEKLLASCISDRGLISITYKGLKRQSVKKNKNKTKQDKKRNESLRWGWDLNRKFSKQGGNAKKYPKTNKKNKKKSSSSLATAN